MRNAMASFISLLFGFLWIPILILFGIWKADVSNLFAIQLGILFIFIEVILPFTCLFILYKKGKIQNIDIIERKDRIIPFLIVITFFFIALMLSSLIKNEFIFQYHLILFITVLVNFFITLFWKISLHMGLNTIAILFINVFTGFQFLFLIAIIPLVYWARFYLKRHSHAQLIAGVVINLLVSGYFLNLFGYL